MEFKWFVCIPYMLPFIFSSCDVDIKSARQADQSGTHGLDGTAETTPSAGDYGSSNPQTIHRTAATSEESKRKDKSKGLDFSAYLNVKSNKSFSPWTTYGDINQELTRGCGINQDPSKCFEIAISRDASKRIVELAETHLDNGAFHNMSFIRDSVGRIEKMTVANVSIALNYAGNTITLKDGSKTYGYNGIPLAPTTDNWGVENGDLNSIILVDGLFGVPMSSSPVHGPLDASRFFDAIYRLYAFKYTTTGVYDSTSNLGKITINSTDPTKNSVLVWYAKGVISYASGEIMKKLLPMLTKQFDLKGELLSVSKYSYNDLLQKTEFNSYQKKVRDSKTVFEHTLYVYDPEDPSKFKSSEKKVINALPVFSDFK